MAKPLTVRPRQAADLSVISRIGSEKLESVLNRLDELKAAVIAASELRSLIQDCLGLKEQAVPLARQLLMLATYCRESNNAPKDAIESLMAGIGDSNLANDERENLNKLAPVLRKLLEQESVNLSAKALHLSFDFANIYRKGNIVTDIRPVFGDSKGRIGGAVVSQTLRIHFSNDSGPNELSIALDNSDILDLRKVCDEALRKAETAKSLMRDKADIKVFVVGEETYGYS